MVVAQRVHLLTGRRHRQDATDDRVALVLEINHLQAAQCVEKVERVVVNTPNVRLNNIAWGTIVSLASVGCLGHRIEFVSATGLRRSSSIRHE